MTSGRGGVCNVLRALGPTKILSDTIPECSCSSPKDNPGHRPRNPHVAPWNIKSALASVGRRSPVRPQQVAPTTTRVFFNTTFPFYYSMLICTHIFVFLRDYYVFWWIRTELYDTAGVMIKQFPSNTTLPRFCSGRGNKTRHVRRHRDSISRVFFHSHFPYNSPAGHSPIKVVFNKKYLQLLLDLQNPLDFHQQHKACTGSLQ